MIRSNWLVTRMSVICCSTMSVVDVVNASPPRLSIWNGTRRVLAIVEDLHCPEVALIADAVTKHARHRVRGARRWEELQCRVRAEDANASPPVHCVDELVAPVDGEVRPV